MSKMLAAARGDEPQSGVFLRGVPSKVVLVVEADDEARALLVRSLSGEYTVHAAHGAMEAAHMLGTFAAPDVILVSAALPDVDGLSFVRSLRTFAALERVPVIFMTPERDGRLLARAIGHGARHCLTKPVQEAELLRRVRACTP